MTQFNGLGVNRMARRPGVTPGLATGAGLDQVLAATTAGLFLGTRRPAGAGAEFIWAELATLGPFLSLVAPAKPIVTEVAWTPVGANGRMFVAIAPDLEQPTTRASVGSGVAFSDDLGATWHWVTGLDPTVATLRAVGRMSFAIAEDARLYVLGDVMAAGPPPTATIWRIPAISATPPVATKLTGVPVVFTDLGRSQRDYDQAIAVDVIPGAPATDRLYFGGNFFDRSPTESPASVWCFDVTPALALAPVNGISQTGAPPTGANANPAGMIGDTVHPDIHVIRLAAAAPNRQVWVGCDGGVYVSTEAGRVNTFAPRCTGMAAVEVNFLASHPTSSHYVAAGMQDNGREVRLGDVVWADTMGGDGGGVAFHPIRSDIIVSQFFFGLWGCVPTGIFVDPTTRVPNQGGGGRESTPAVSSFYSGAAAVRRTATAGRIAVGTNRVWLTDNLGSTTPNTWQVLPFPSGSASDPRPGGGDAPGTQGRGVPGGGPLAAVAGGIGPLGQVMTQKWASATELLVLFANGVVRWTQNTGTGAWTADVLLAPAGVVLAPATTGAPNPATSMLTDLCPVPGTRDFYLTTTGDTAVPPSDTCFFFDDATRTFQPTLLRHQLNNPPPPAVSPPAVLGPRDPAFAVVVDPAATTDVYVGTVTGVWRGVRGAPHTWTPQPNGLPQALVQDLSIWVDPTGAAGSPRLLRAAMQSRGVWELDLAAALEPERTYVRVHPFDDRRRFPTPMENPRRAPGATAEREISSPDIVVRPKASPTTAPAWRPPVGGFFDATHRLPYQLWTFQTAFRWIFPGVIANGIWTRAFGDLVQLHRSNVAALAPAQAKITRPVWDAVVGGTRINAAGTVTTSPADPLAVYRAPWHSPAAMTANATELDLMECVVVPTTVAGVPQVFSEESTVDVLIHHRDTRPLAVNSAFVLLLWRFAASDTLVQNVDVTPIPTYVRDVIAAETASTALPAAPVDWTPVPVSGTRMLHRLPIRLDARMPRAISIDVNLSAVPLNNSVLFLAIVGSAADPCTTPVTLPATPRPADLARRWPYAALRLVRVVPR